MGSAFLQVGGKNVQKTEIMGRFWELIPLMYVSIDSTRKGENGDAEMPKLRNDMDMGADRLQIVHTRG